MRKSLAEKWEGGQDQKGSKKSSGERLKKQTCKRKEAAETFGKMVCSSLIISFFFFFLVKLCVGIGNGKIFILKNPRVSSWKVKAESTFFLAGLRKCGDASKMYEALNLHSECWGHMEFTAELSKTDETWKMIPESGTALILHCGAGREAGASRASAAT